MTKVITAYTNSGSCDLYATLTHCNNIASERQGLMLWVTVVGLVSPNTGLVANAVRLVANCYVFLCMHVS